MSWSIYRPSFLTTSQPAEGMQTFCFNLGYLEGKPHAGEGVFDHLFGRRAQKSGGRRLAAWAPPPVSSNIEFFALK